MTILPKKESLTIEFKSDCNCLSDTDLVDTIVGLTNTEGGVLYLGIEDNGTVTGLHKKHMDILPVISFVANHTMPSVAIRAEIIIQDGKSILQLIIPKSKQNIVATSNGKILKRRLKADGTPENIPLYPFEIMSRLSDLGIFDYSAQPFPHSTINDFDPNEILRLRKIISKRHGDSSLLELSNEELFKALRLVIDVNGQSIPTVTGVLLIGKESIIDKLLPTAQAAFQVLDGTSIRVNEQIRKPLLATFDLFTDLLKPWNPEKEVVDGLFHIPVPEFDHNAFREALINAFCHRDYSMLQMTRVLIDNEGLTISSPGGFIDGVTLKNLLTVEPHGRNPALADALKRIGLAERTGRGIDRIFAGSIFYGRPLPDYSESSSTNVKVFIPRSHPDVAFMKMIANEHDKSGHFLSINSLLILSALRTEHRLDIRRMTELTNIGEGRINALVETLVEQGLIEAKGTGRGRVYILSATVYRTSKNTAAYVRQAGFEKVRQPELILQYVKAQGSITRGEAATLLNISNVTAYRLLKRMVLEQKLNQTGNKHNTKYLLFK
jgi:ATP-dependent DNA helicase RecG